MVFKDVLTLIKSTCDEPDEVVKKDAISVWNILDENTTGSVSTDSF